MATATLTQTAARQQSNAQLISVLEHANRWDNYTLRTVLAELTARQDRGEFIWGTR